MKWRCALIQRRLADYPDGDLRPFLRRLIAAHLEGCPDCRRELQELKEVEQLYLAHPVPDPGEDFWQEFDRELHVKLAKASQVPGPKPTGLGLPYYVAGAAAVAAVLVLAVYLGPFQSPAPGPPASPPTEAKVAEKGGKPARLAPQALKTAPPPAASPEMPASLAAKSAPTPAEEAELSLAAGRDRDHPRMGEESLWDDEDILSWDVETVVSDLTPEERAQLKKRLETGR
jgi:hypothetical protein